MKLTDVYALREASVVWGVPYVTLQNACKGQKGYPPRFTSEECRQSGTTWLVSREGMIRLYGEPKNEK